MEILARHLLKSRHRALIHAARFLLAVLLCAPALPLRTLAQSRLQLPAPTGLVNDFAGVLDAASVQRMTRIAEDVRNKSRGEIAVVTLPDIGQYQPSDVALQIGREWRVGKIGDPGDPTRNAGAVILLVPRETNATGRGFCRIETGQGTEGFITDAIAGDICREATPAFAQRQYSRGLELVTFRTAERFAREFGFSLDTGLVRRTEPLPAASRRRGGISPFLVFFIIMMLMVMFGGMGGGRRARRRHSRNMIFPVFIPTRGGWDGGGGWGGGGWGGGGGFGGFGGGGGFSGGGGGSSW